MSNKDKARKIAEEICFNYHQADVCILHVEKAALIALELSEQKVKELVSAINTINRSKHHEVPESITGDNEPCYWQRKEWVDWILELANEADDLTTNVA